MYIYIYVCVCVCVCVYAKECAFMRKSFEKQLFLNSTLNNYHIH